MRLILAIIAIAGAALLSAVPGRQVISAEHGRLLVFPGDSLDMASVTFTIDGDTVSRDSFFTLRRPDIRSIIVTPAPANLVEVTTRRAAMCPLLPDDLPADILYIVDGDTIDREAFTAIPSADIVSMVMVRAHPPRIEITTSAGLRPKMN